MVAVVLMVLDILRMCRCAWRASGLSGFGSLGGW